MNYLTPTLLNSWLYYLNSEYCTIDDFLRTLKREPFERTKPMQDGIDFEDEVFKGMHEFYNPYIQGADYQVKLTGEYNGIMIVGVADFIRPDLIIDVKKTKSYELGKYFNTSQHIIYPYLTDINNFKYLIRCGKQDYEEEYKYKEGQAEKLIDDFISWLKATNLYETWKLHWNK